MFSRGTARVWYRPLMATILTGISAARFWASYGAPGMPRALIAPRYDLADTRPRAADVDGLRQIGLFAADEPVHVLVADQSLRRRPKGIAGHSFDDEFPTGSLCRIPPDLFVVSPGMCLMQLASALSLPALAYVCTMFCGIYSVGLDAARFGNGKPSQPLPRTKPVAKLDDLREFLSRASGLKGVKPALRAVDLSAERARSPMEVIAYLHLCLPPFHGGYSLPKPLLNQYVKLDSGELLEADFVWPNERVAVEYLGEDYHASVESMRKDSKRGNAYETNDYCELVLTAEHFRNFDLLDQVGLFLRKKLGRRADLREDLRDRQTALRATLNAIRNDLNLPR